MSKIQKLLSLSSRCTVLVGNQAYNKLPKHCSVKSYSTSAVDITAASTKLTMTGSCVQQLKQVLDDPNQFLRVMVEGGGCSGFSYKFDIDTSLQDDDCVFERDGVRIVADEMSLELIGGSEVDYVEELIRSAFIIKNNPQSSNQCSCGVSFSVDL